MQQLLTQYKTHQSKCNEHILITDDFVFVKQCFLRAVYCRFCRGRPTGALKGLGFFGDGFRLDGECFLGEPSARFRLSGEFTICRHVNRISINNTQNKQQLK